MLTALDIHTNETVAVQPIVIAQSGAWDVLLLADANTGKGIRLSTDTPYFGCARHAGCNQV